MEFTKVFESHYVVLFDDTFNTFIFGTKTFEDFDNLYDLFCYFETYCPNTWNNFIQTTFMNKMVDFVYNIYKNRGEKLINITPVMARKIIYDIEF